MAFGDLKEMGAGRIPTTNQGDGHAVQGFDYEEISDTDKQTWDTLNSVNTENNADRDKGYLDGKA